MAVSLTVQLDNLTLVYEILRHRKRFEKLRTFTLESALEEMERTRLSNEEKTRHSRPSPAPSAHTATKINNEPEHSSGLPLSPHEGLSEKAKGKLPEGSLTEASRTPSSSSLQSSAGAPQRQNSAAGSTLSEISLLPGAKHGFLPTEEWVSGTNDRVLMSDSEDRRFNNGAPACHWTTYLR